MVVLSAKLRLSGLRACEVSPAPAVVMELLPAEIVEPRSKPGARRLRVTDGASEGVGVPRAVETIEVSERLS